MQTLTLKEIVSSALDLARQGKLGMQNFSFCSYDYGGGYRCVIGAALSQETLDEIEERDLQSEIISELKARGIVKMDETELRQAAQLQEYHDFATGKASEIKAPDFWERLNFYAKEFGLEPFDWQGYVR